MNDKTFFKELVKLGKDKSYGDDIANSFPAICLELFWTHKLSDDDIENAIVALETNDESIDGFFIDEENQEINIIQCKSCQSYKSRQALKKEWLAYLAAAPQKLKDHDYIDKHKNERIKEIAAEYIEADHNGYKTALHFFHLGRCGNKTVLEHHDNIKYYDWDKIKEEYQEYLSKDDRTEPEDIEINLSHDPIQASWGKHKTLISIMTGDELINLRGQHRYKLFDKNLRFSLGKNKINKNITQTAKGEPELFYFYNNGITITSAGFKYKPTNSKLKIDYPQIINGAQTVNALYEAYKEKQNKIERKHPEKDSEQAAKEAFKKICLLFRVIQEKQEKTSISSKVSAFEENVVRYNNSQNSIKESDFYANNEEQIELQRLFCQYGYFYEIKRGDRKFLEGKENNTHNLLEKKRTDFKHWDEKITMEKLASIQMAYKIDPALDKCQKANIFGHANDRYYEQVFSSKDKMDECYVKEMILAWHLYHAIKMQSDIYGTGKKKGQIVSKISQLERDDTKLSEKLTNISEIIGGSYLFNDPIKKDCGDIKNFFDEKDSLREEVEGYAFFSHGNYLTLSIFHLILDKCDYIKTFIGNESGLFQNQVLIDKMVQKWLKKVLDSLVKPEYAESQKSGITVKTFYRRNSTWQKIQQRFKKLRYKTGEELEEIFPIPSHFN